MADADALRELRARPLCAEAAADRAEPLGATASRVVNWLIVEYDGYWPYDPLDASVFAGRLREHLRAQLAALPLSRLFLVRRPGRAAADGRVRVVYGRTPERGRRFYRLDLAGHPDLLELDVVAALAGDPVGEPLEHPLLLVCTHGKRDRCCARYGRALCEELAAEAPPGWVWQSTHVGGDRFAGNAVVLPDGLYYGRVGGGAGRLLDRHLAGRVDLERYRGRSCWPFPVQAAEAEVRERTGLDGIHDLRLLEQRRAGEGWEVDFLAEVSGEVHRVEVVVEEGEAALLTCKAEEPRRPRRFVARAYELVG